MLTEYSIWRAIIALEASSATKASTTAATTAAASSTSTTSKVAHGCYVAEPASVSATEWAGAVAAVVGGKAGGKGQTSQGIGFELGKVDEAIEVAERWIREKLRL